mgnify:CR=1 FL=1
MSVREYSQDEAESINNASSISINKEKSLGSAVRELQKAVNAGGGGGLPVATQAEAIAGVVNDKTMTPLRVLESIMANAPGGGAAYPDNHQIVNTNKTLSASDQGYIIVTATVTVTLPAAPTPGMTFKIVGFTNYTINPNGILVGAYNTAAAFSPQVGKMLNLIATDAFGPIVWGVNDVSFANWSSSERYKVRDIVSHNSVLYIAKAVNQTYPLSDSAAWSRISADAEVLIV